MIVGFRRISLFVIAALVLELVAAVVWTDAAMMATKMSAQLTGADETPPTPSNATGSFQGTIAGDNKSISYKLTFSKLTSRTAAAHIHVGAKGAPGPAGSAAAAAGRPVRLQAAR